MNIQPTSAQASSREGPLRAAIYARVSSPKQASIPQQIDLCRQRCELLEIDVKFILKDHGVSGKDIERPQLMRLFQLCEDRRVDIVVVWKLDRLVRSLRHLLNTYEWLQERKVDLHSVTEQLDTSNAFGRFNFRNIASAAELERELIGERARMGKLAQAHAGKWTTHSPPIGYRLTEDRKLVIDPKEAKLVRRIFRMYMKKIPLTEISRRLSEEGHQTRRGRRFSPSTVDSILRNLIYDGTFEALGVKHEMPELRIISPRMREDERKRRGRRCKDNLNNERRKIAIDAVFDDYFAHLQEMESETI